MLTLIYPTDYSALVIFQNEDFTIFKNYTLSIILVFSLHVICFIIYST